MSDGDCGECAGRRRTLEAGGWFRGKGVAGGVGRLVVARALSLVREGACISEAAELLDGTRVQ